MGRKEEGAGQGHLGGTGPGDSTEQDKTGAPAWPGSALSHCLAAHKTASNLDLMEPCMQERAGL